MGANLGFVSVLMAWLGWPNRSCRDGPREWRGGKVDRCGTSDEIGDDTGHASTSCFVSAVDPTGEMTDFTFDLRRCRPAIGLPLGRCLLELGLLLDGQDAALPLAPGSK